MTNLASLFGAIALILLGGLFAAIDAAIGTVSSARVTELVRDERPGAARLARLIAERPRYVNLVVLLRIACETTATVLLVGHLYGRLPFIWALVVAAAARRGRLRLEAAVGAATLKNGYCFHRLGQQKP